MVDVETWKDLHELYPKNPKILENIVAQLEDKIARQQTRIKAMQRKIDRYKKYARIKNRKENERIEKECKRITDFFDSGVFNSGMQVKARFIKTWRAGETK